MHTHLHGAWFYNAFSSFHFPLLFHKLSTIARRLLLRPPLSSSFCPHVWTYHQFLFFGKHTPHTHTHTLTHTHSHTHYLLFLSTIVTNCWKSLYKFKKCTMFPFPWTLTFLAVWLSSNVKKTTYWYLQIRLYTFACEYIYDIIRWQGLSNRFDHVIRGSKFLIIPQ